MSTIGEALDVLEAALFVGREAELAASEQWLTATTGATSIRYVRGHGGLGKSALLRAFARRARALGRPVILLDSREFPHTPEEFLRALAPPSGDEERRPLQDAHVAAAQGGLDSCVARW
jgi:hypothetical protein